MINIKYDNSIYYSCYSPFVKSSLDIENIQYIGFPSSETFIHSKTKRRCWVYIRTENLNRHLARLRKEKSIALGR